jgi:hypothetical protein
MNQNLKMGSVDWQRNACGNRIAVLYMNRIIVSSAITLERFACLQGRQTRWESLEVFGLPYSMNPGLVQQISIVFPVFIFKSKFLLKSSNVPFLCVSHVLWLCLFHTLVL